MSLKLLLKIPQVKKFLQDGDAYADLEVVVEKYDLPGERMNELLDLTDAVLDGQLEVKDIPSLLEEAFEITNEQAVSVAADIVGVRLFPLRLFIKGIEEQLTAWGADPKAYDQKEVSKESITADQLAQRLAKDLDLSFSELLMKRLAFLLEQRVNEQKTDESLRIFFGRPLTIGGMGLPKEQIDALMAAVGEAVVGVRIISEEEGAEMGKTQVAATENGKQMKTDGEARHSGLDPFGHSPQGEPESKESQLKQNAMDPGLAHRPTAEESVSGMTGTTPITALEIPPSHEIAAEVPVVSSPVQEERKEVARAAARVTAPQVKKVDEPLMQESPDAQAQKKAERAKKMQDDAVRTAFTEAVALALEKAQGVLEEAKVSSGAFADITGKMLRGIRDGHQTRDVLEHDYHVQGNVLAVLMQALLEAEEAYRVATDALMKIEHMDTHISEEDAEAFEEREAIAADARFDALLQRSPRPAPARVELTVGSVAPMQDEYTQKKVADVVVGNRLMGPVEQLETMTLADFRRLSTNPHEAVRKMEALLLALQKTSYEERLRGVLAWRKSPLAQLSLALMTESLNTGVAMAEIAARRRSQGKESLGPAEMQALSQWNEKVRF